MWGHDRSSISRSFSTACHLAVTQLHSTDSCFCIKVGCIWSKLPLSSLEGKSFSWSNIRMNDLHRHVRCDLMQLVWILLSSLNECFSQTSRKNAQNTITWTAVIIAGREHVYFQKHVFTSISISSDNSWTQSAASNPNICLSNNKLLLSRFSLNQTSWLVLWV